MDEKLRHLLETESAEIEENPDAVVRSDSTVTRTSRPRTLQIRLSDEEYAQIQRIAEDRHLAPSTFARSVLLSHADR